MTNPSTGKPDDVLSIEIISADEEFTFDFQKTTKVSEAIDAAVNQFELNAADKYTLKFPGDKGEKLDPNRPLVSYGLADGASLVLTSHGGGV
jgi:hypothetical protein